MRTSTQSTMYRVMSGAMGVVPRPPHPRDRAEARILLIEDDAAVANLVATILEAEGYAVTHAATPDETRRLLSGRGPTAFDLVLSTPFTHAPAAPYVWFDELCAYTRAHRDLCALPPAGLCRLSPPGLRRVSGGTVRCRGFDQRGGCRLPLTQGDAGVTSTGRT